MHSDGSHSILFSIWDHNATAKNAWWDEGSSPWCARFGGEGEGAHCGRLFKFEEGRNYTFALEYDADKSVKNGSGEFWSAEVRWRGQAASAGGPAEDEEEVGCRPASLNTLPNFSGWGGEEIGCRPRGGRLSSRLPSTRR